MARDGQRGDSIGRAALLRQTDGEGVRDRHVRAGDGEARCGQVTCQSGLSTNRRMMNDLDAIAVRIVEVARSGAVTVRLRLRVEPHAVALQKRSPSIDVL